MQKVKYFIKDTPIVMSEGYIIKLLIDIPSWRCIDQYYKDIGPIPSRHIDTMYDLLGKIVECVPDHDSDNSHRAQKLLGPLVGWPHNVDGQPAILLDFSVDYSDGKGNIYHTIPMVKDDESA